MSFWEKGYLATAGAVALPVAGAVAAAAAAARHLS